MKYKFIFFLCIIILFGALLRLDRLGDRSFWSDEIWQIEVARHTSDIKTVIIPPLPSGVNQYSRAEPRLSHFIIYHFMRKFGENEFIVRFPSVIVGILSIVFIAVVGNLVFGYKEGLVAALLLAISPYHIYYSQEARPYALLVLFSLCSLYFFYKLLFSDSIKWWYWLGFLGSTFLNISNSFISFQVICIEGIFAIVYLFFQKRKFWKTVLVWLLIAGIIGFIFKGYIMYGLQFLIRNLGGEHKVRFLVFNWGFFRDIFNCYLIPYNTGLNAKIAFLLYILLFLVGFKNYRAHKWLYILLTSWIALPFGLIFTVFKPFEYFNPRYLIVILPIVLLIIARGIVWCLDKVGATIRDRYPPSLLLQRNRGMYALSYIVGIGLIIGLNVQPLLNYRYSEKDNWRSAAEYLAQNVMKGDVILVSPPVNHSFLMYYFRVRNTQGVPVYGNFKQITQKYRYTWIVSYLDEDWYWELHYKEAYDEYKRFRDKLEVIEEMQLSPHPLIVKTKLLEDKHKVIIDLDKSVKEKILFNPQYKILHPQFYNQQGRFSIELNSPETEFEKAYLKVKTHVIYKNNYVKLSLFDKEILYVGGKDTEGKKTAFIDITEMLKIDKKVVIKGELFTDSETSIELFDVRIEEIVLCYEEDNSIS